MSLNRVLKLGSEFAFFYEARWIIATCKPVSWLCLSVFECERLNVNVVFVSASATVSSPRCGVTSGDDGKWR